jgi:uncharacterized protein YdaU (DUF1376 family)
MHYYQLNIKSYQAATSHLSNEEDLAYRRLMDYYYDTESPISAKPNKPTALVWLSRRLRLAIPSLESVLNEFFIFDESCWKNEYCEQVIAEYRAYHDKQRANGSKGGRGNKRIDKANAKPNKPTALPNKATAKPTINNKQETINNKYLKTKTPDGVSDEVFNDFLKMRKAMKAPVTETAIKGLKREAEKANLSLEGVMTLCCQNGWRGFKADWLMNPKNAHQDRRDKNLAALHELTGGLLKTKTKTDDAIFQSINTIDMESENARIQQG